MRELGLDKVRRTETGRGDAERNSEESLWGEMGRTAIPRSWELTMKSLGSHIRFWSWDVSIIFERSSWQPLSRTASSRGTRGWETSKEVVPIDTAGDAGAMETGVGKKPHRGA